MPLVSTSAIVLHTFPYGESSKIVRFATRDHGVVSAIAKGAHRAKSKFGARLQPLSEGTAKLYVKQNRELHTLSEFDLTRQRQELASHLHRYAAAAALSELVLRFSPQEPHPELYELFRESLDWLMEVDGEGLASASLASMWTMVSALGFAPSLDVCAVDGRPLDTGRAAFSTVDGGFVCSACAPSRETASLAEADRMALVSFVSGSPPPEGVSPRHAAAHRRLLARFVRRHVAEARELGALDFWETLS